jgi:adenosylcobyric acid synthase
MDDLAWLKEEGLDQKIVELHQKGTRIIGVCGGFQMLGCELLDPDAVEGSGGREKGLSLLPVKTIFQEEKKTKQMRGRLAKGIGSSEMMLSGYEIHLGRTELDVSKASPFLLLEDGREDGAVLHDHTVMGTYFHGIFHNREFTRELVNQIRREKGIDEVHEVVTSDAERREEAYNLLASHVKKHVNMEQIYQFIK